MVERLSRVDAGLTAEAKRTVYHPRSRHRAARACALFCFLVGNVFLLAAQASAAFDHSHSTFGALLQRHVVWINDGHASEVDYAGIKREQSVLKNYLAELAAVTSQQYSGFTSPERLAFLLNAYNAYTIDFVLTRYPEIESIRELGSLFSSPWKKRLFPLLGEERSLDEIEHEMIRKPGDFDDPRIHMAVNCASVGCPALRDEPYVASRLNAQLDDAVNRFVGDRSRNRADGKGLWISKIFDWYAGDFEKHSGSVAAWLAPHAARLSDDPDVQASVASASLRIRYLDYDWAQNDLRSPN